MVQIVCTGKGSAMALPKVIQQVQALAQTLTPKVLYLGTPSYDRDDIFSIQTKGFQNANCPIFKLDLSEISTATAGADTSIRATPSYPTVDEMQERIDDSDVIMVSGGNTLYAMNRWKHLGMDSILKNAAAKDDGPVFCGGSAGAICWFEKGNSDSMNPMTFLHPDPNLTEEQKNDWDYISMNGLGILKGLCVPHYDAKQHNGSMRFAASEKMVRDMSDYPCIGIDENAAFVVNGDVVRVIEGVKGAKCYKKLHNSITGELEVSILGEEIVDGSSYSLSTLGLV
eukprot:CAMPEP_0194080788 /NCGR_PEP_ID=MMETSP0149-20130528/6722_1 /TAXON_ID=122233 /ORGANISM="Chaetoceros debilis, Strain MM31A-1" /LENGTH=283 /DNA_ID=CAMNT_0038762575 /DNA_START=139 /DNA_END=990 /DNA_ORIENTATION=-